MNKTNFIVGRRTMSSEDEPENCDDDSINGQVIEISSDEECDENSSEMEMKEENNSPDLEEFGIVQEHIDTVNSNEIPAAADFVEIGMESNDNEVTNINTEAMLSPDSGRVSILSNDLNRFSTGIANFSPYSDDFEMDLFNSNKDTRDPNQHRKPLSNSNIQNTVTGAAQQKNSPMDNKVTAQPGLMITQAISLQNNPSSMNLMPNGLIGQFSGYCSPKQQNSTPFQREIHQQNTVPNHNVMQQQSEMSHQSPAAYQSPAPQRDQKYNRNSCVGNDQNMANSMNIPTSSKLLQGANPATIQQQYGGLCVQSGPQMNQNQLYAGNKLSNGQQFNATASPGTVTYPAQQNYIPSSNQVRLQSKMPNSVQPNSMQNNQPIPSFQQAFMSPMQNVTQSSSNLVGQSQPNSTIPNNSCYRNPMLQQNSAPYQRPMPQSMTPHQSPAAYQIPAPQRDQPASGNLRVGSVQNMTYSMKAPPPYSNYSNTSNSSMLRHHLVNQTVSPNNLYAGVRHSNGQQYNGTASTGTNANTAQQNCIPLSTKVTPQSKISISLPPISKQSNQAVPNTQQGHANSMQFSASNNPVGQFSPNSTIFQNSCYRSPMLHHPISTPYQRSLQQQNMIQMPHQNASPYQSPAAYQSPTPQQYNTDYLRGGNNQKMPTYAMDTQQSNPNYLNAANPSMSQQQYSDLQLNQTDPQLNQNNLFAGSKLINSEQANLTASSNGNPKCNVTMENSSATHNTSFDPTLVAEIIKELEKKYKLVPKGQEEFEENDISYETNTAINEPGRKQPYSNPQKRQIESFSSDSSCEKSEKRRKIKHTPSRSKFTSKLLNWGSSCDSRSTSPDVSNDSDFLNHPSTSKQANKQEKTMKKSGKSTLTKYFIFSIGIFTGKQILIFFLSN